MKKIAFTLLLSTGIFISLFATDPVKVNFTEGFAIGNPGIQSISALTFGPENILFIGDATSAHVIAIDMTNHCSKQTSKIDIKQVDKTLAMQLGTTADQVKITDMAVHAGTQQVFLAVQHGSGTSVLFKVVDNQFVAVPMDEISHSKTELIDAVAVDAVDRRKRPLRKWAISDLAYDNGKVMITGLSNKEFGSTFRSLDFPFSKEQSYGSLEIYHAAHGKYETHSPVKTFTTLTLNGKPHIIASYTCTPLVVFPIDQLKGGVHTKGRTIAELGNWNTPLDIIELSNDGKRFVLLANSSRALMKIDVKDIEAFGDSMTERVEKRSGTAGVDFIALPFVNVLQLDKLSDDTFLMLQRKSDGDLVLKTGGKRWL